MSDSYEPRWPFAGHLPPERAAEWEAAKARLEVGATVTGEVVARRPFGVFVDIGVGFPALLEVLQFRDHPHPRYRDVANYPEVGSMVTARVVALNDRGRQVALTQRDPHPYLDRSE